MAWRYIWLCVLETGCLNHLRHLVLLTGQPIVVTHMKFVVARECCRSVGSQSGRQLQLEPEVSFIFLKNLRAFFTLKSCFRRDEWFKVLWTDLHVSLGSEGFWGMYLVKNDCWLFFGDEWNSPWQTINGWQGFLHSTFKLATCSGVPRWWYEGKRISFGEEQKKVKESCDEWM